MLSNPSKMISMTLREGEREGERAVNIGRLRAQGGGGVLAVEEIAHGRNCSLANKVAHLGEEEGEREEEEEEGEEEEEEH